MIAMRYDHAYPGAEGGTGSVREISSGYHNVDVPSLGYPMAREWEIDRESRLRWPYVRELSCRRSYSVQREAGGN